MSEIPTHPNEKLTKMAARLGYVGLVSHRQTIPQAYADAIVFCEQERGSIGVHLLMNTMALQWAQERLDTLEMMDAIISYCEDDSKSPRRKAEVIHGAKLIHERLTGEEYGAETGTREPEEPGG